MRWGNDSIDDTLRLRCTVREKTPRMLLLPNPRNGRLRRASPLLLLAAVLLCCVPGGTGLPGRLTPTVGWEPFIKNCGTICPVFHREVII